MKLCNHHTNLLIINNHSITIIYSPLWNIEYSPHISYTCDVYPMKIILLISINLYSPLIMM